MPSGLAPRDAVADQDHRGLRLLYHLKGAMDRILRGIRVRSAPHLERLHVYALPGEVLGQLDMRGAGLLEPSEAKGLADDLRRRVGDADPRRPLRDRRQHPVPVDVTVLVVVDALEPGLARYRNQPLGFGLRVCGAGE